MDLHERFDPDLLIKFRKKHRLSKAAMVRLLQGNGMPLLGYSTYMTWESGSHQPQRERVVLLLAAMESEGARLEAVRRAGKDVEV